MLAKHKDIRTNNTLCCSLISTDSTSHWRSDNFMFQWCYDKTVLNQGIVEYFIQAALKFSGIVPKVFNLSPRPNQWPKDQWYQLKCLGYRHLKA